uniref:Uncharacterized protein n=1 Tax=Ananas comosus var. bracteatus TaxID=296719 RepID=A0A6V7PHR8_ANACO|nr:unnamed protein product [Ananas comosus var. bracteatus]
MGAGLKKDLRVSRVGPGGSLNAFFFLHRSYFTRLATVSGSSPGWPAAPGKRIEEASDSFMHTPLGSGDIAQLQGAYSKENPVPLGREYLNRTNRPPWISLLRNKTIRMRLGQLEVLCVWEIFPLRRSIDLRRRERERAESIQELLVLEPEINRHTPQSTQNPIGTQA